MSISTFIFDIYGVIVNTGAEAREKLAREGYNPEDLNRIGGEGDLGMKYFTGHYTYDDYKGEVKKIFGTDTDYILNTYLNDRYPLSVSKNAFNERIGNIFSCKLEDDLPETVGILQLIDVLHQKFDLCLFSGNNPHEVAMLDEKFHFLHYFQYSVFSFEIGVDKPDIRMFMKLRETLPSPFTSCIYIDDREENIRVAKTLQLTGVLMKDIQ